MKWDNLDMKTKSKYMNFCIKNGLSDLNSIRKVVNTYEDGGIIESIKGVYNNYVRPAISNTYDANDESSFDNAYQAARSNGNKTFVYKGKHYNTDYSGKYHKLYEEDVASGKAEEWEKQYPNYTHPLLRKAKQEELDTYGITNEQTKDHSFIDNFMYENIPRQGYNVNDFISNIRGEHSSSSRYDNTEDLLKAVNQKYNNKFKDIQYEYNPYFGFKPIIDPKIAEEDIEEYKAFTQDLNMSSLEGQNKHGLEVDYYFNRPIKNNSKNLRISEYRTGKNPYYYTMHNNIKDAFVSDNIKNLSDNKSPEEAYADYDRIVTGAEEEDPKIIKDLETLGLAPYRGGFNIVDYTKLNNAPKELLNKYSSILVFVPSEGDTYFDGVNDIINQKGNHLVQDFEDDYYQELPGKYSDLIQRINKKEKPNNTNIAIVGDLMNNDLGVYTLGIPEEKGVFSIYDKWDINPFGSGNDEPIINVGTPFEIYDRAYKNKPNIDSLYKKFKK